MKKKYALGTIEASEQLIKDLYINLRNEVNAWSKITMQTPQARMGYIGQHLVSVVTGYPGGKSGARGYDLVIDEHKYGEIKTCYRVDQLGACVDCGAAVSSLETQCSVCKSINILRKDDSKWLISIRHDDEFSKILDPYRYYFVLFEFEELNNVTNNTIVASIWEVNPKEKGFAFCMIDYYLNIRSKSDSKAPFNMWPHQLKFSLTNPKLIYRSYIKENGEIKTTIFPSLNNQVITQLLPLNVYSTAQTITCEITKNVLLRLDPKSKTSKKNKADLLLEIEHIRQNNNISNLMLCNLFAEEIYLPRIVPYKSKLPQHLKDSFTELQ